MTMHDCVLLNIINIKHFLYQYIVLKYTQNSISRLYISRIVTDFQSKSSENMDQKNVSPVQSEGSRRSPRKKPVQSEEQSKGPRRSPRKKPVQSEEQSEVPRRSPRKKQVQSEEQRTSPMERKQNVEKVDHSV